MGGGLFFIVLPVMFFRRSAFSMRYEGKCQNTCEHDEAHNRNGKPSEDEHVDLAAGDSRSRACAARSDNTRLEQDIVDREADTDG